MSWVPSSFEQVQHLMAIHPDYGTQVQSLLTKHNAEAQKVGRIFYLFVFIFILKKSVPFVIYFLFVLLFQNSNVHVYSRPTALNASAKM